MKLLDTVSNILNVPMREGKWRQYITILDRDGKIDKRTQLELILALCEKVSELENLIETPKTTITEEPAAINVVISPAELLKLKRQENIKKAQAARKAKYELKRAKAQQNT